MLSARLCFPVTNCDSIFCVFRTAMGWHTRFACIQCVCVLHTHDPPISSEVRAKAQAIPRPWFSHFSMPFGRLRLACWSLVDGGRVL